MKREVIATLILLVAAVFISIFLWQQQNGIWVTGGILLCLFVAAGCYLNAPPTVVEVIIEVPAPIPPFVPEKLELIPPIHEPDNDRLFAPLKNLEEAISVSEHEMKFANELARVRRACNSRQKVSVNCRNT